MFRVIIGIMILASHLAVGQSFGQNKVQYRNFDFESPWEGTRYIVEETKGNKDK